MGVLGQDFGYYEKLRLRRAGEKLVKERMAEAGVSMAALKKERLAYELVLCEAELEIRGRELREALKAAQEAAAKGRFMRAPKAGRPSEHAVM